MSATAYELLKAVGDVIIANKEFLTDLDGKIGDGDHGINMARGFEAVAAKTAALGEDKDIATILKTVGMTLVTSVGGAAGPLYGTAFLRAAGPGQGKHELDGASVALMLSAAIGGIKERGKATRGEKTMLDALEPAYDAYQAAQEAGKSIADSLAKACQAASEGVEYTKTIIATKGRASYLGERSLGHQDPGATSSYLMLKAVVDCLQRDK
ncbi:dihydroxyacetone kinase subunit DhaL [Azotosporobacter soli]|uniref:dihydroxyacetone kinase subunit DhaL n=1 Tax=Azotosporobacter soli TaxID=3055040 RepID=UPI0031FF2775